MLSIIVVGGGLAGVATALALRRAGHQVQIIEKTQLTCQDTQGLVAQIGPKVNGVLGDWGIEAETARGVLINEVAGFDQDGTLRSLEDGPKPPGWKYYEYSKLHQALLNTSIASEGLGCAVKLILGKRVDSVDLQSGIVTLQGGQTFHGDVIVGADGWNSTCRNAVSYEMKSILCPPRTAVYFTVDVTNLQGNAVVQRFQHQTHRYENWNGQDVNLKVCSVEPNKIMISTSLGASNESDFSADVIWKLIMQAFQNADSQFKELLSTVKPADIRFWSYSSAPGIETWTLNRLVLIGDAAHPFLADELPGPSQTISGADALSKELSSGLKADEISQHLAAWEVPRKERVKTIQGMERKDWPST